MLQPVSTLQSCISFALSAGNLGLPLRADLPTLFPCSIQHSPNMDTFAQSSSSSIDSTSTFDFAVCDANGETLQAKYVEYRGHNLACFDICGATMICLPQAYDFFLKNLVGGLHTVYTKLRRLEINPLVCNVEQVRILRSMGAIQPGVNRCKLIAITDFDKLFDDCTARPGRPAKRLSSLEEVNGKHIKTEESAQCLEESTQQNTVFLERLLPQLQQQMLMQQMIAAAQNASGLNMKSDLSCNLNLEGTTNMGNVDMSSRSFERVTESSCLTQDLIPLNLSKNLPEPNEHDSLECTSKEKRSERGQSSNSSGSGTSSSTMSLSSAPKNDNDQSALVFAKIIDFVDMAGEQIRYQQALLERDRKEFDELRTRFYSKCDSQEKLRTELEFEKKRSHLHFRRFCKAKHEIIRLREQLLPAPPVAQSNSSSSLSSSIQNDDSDPSNISQDGSPDESS